jgi:PAS domain S-box-containing protein
MNDENKTREQLIDELAEMCQRITGLEALDTQREQAEEELRSSEQRLRILFEFAPDAYYLSDLRGNFTDGNKAAEEMIGYQKEEMIGKSFLKLSLLPPKQIPKAAALLAKNLLGQPTGPDEFTLRRKDGSQVVVEIRTFPIRIEGKALVLGIARDITERKQAEEALEKRNRALQALHEVMLDIGAELEMSTLLHRVVERAVDLLSGDQGGGIYLYQSEEGVLRLVESLGVGADQIGAILRPGEGAAGRVFQSRQPLIVDDYSNWEGRAAPFAGMSLGTMLVVPLLWREQVIGVLALVADRRRRTFGPDDLWLAEMFAAQAAVALVNARLHDRLQQHALTLEEEVLRQTAEIRRQQEQTEAILRNIDDAVVITDTQGAITYINQAFTTLLGYQPNDVIGKHIALLDSDLTLPAIKQEFMRSVRERESWHGELVMQCKDGAPCEIEMAIVPVPGPSGEVESFAGSMRDIGRFKRLDRMKTRFMQLISHELRTPLSSIQIYAHLLKSDKAPDERERFVEKLEAQTRRLIRLTEKVIDATRLSDWEAMNEWEKVSVARMIDETMTRFQAAAEVARVTLTADAPLEGLPPVLGDAAWLARALGELVENALTFTPAGGEAWLSARLIEEGGSRQVAIDVSDNGPGTNPEDLARILADTFYRGEIGQAGHIPGIGLGLTLVRMIAERHGGRLVAESTGQPGQGSTYRLVLPAADWRRENDIDIGERRR